MVSTEWSLTSVGWQFVLVVLAGFCFYRLVSTVVPALAEGDMELATRYGVRQLLAPVFVLVLPFVIAANARKQGRRFGVWFTLSLVFSSLFVYIAYLIVAREPVQKPERS